MRAHVDNSRCEIFFSLDILLRISLTKRAGSKTKVKTFQGYKASVDVIMTVIEMQVFVSFFLQLQPSGQVTSTKFNYRFHQWDTLKTAPVRCTLTIELFRSTGIMLGTI